MANRLSPHADTLTDCTHSCIGASKRTVKLQMGQDGAALRRVNWPAKFHVLFIWCPSDRRMLWLALHQTVSQSRLNTYMYSSWKLVTFHELAEQSQLVADQLYVWSDICLT